MNNYRNVYLVTKNNQLKVIPTKFIKPRGLGFHQAMKQASMNIQYAFHNRYYLMPLEISSLSTVSYAKNASAMSLQLTTKHGTYTVEQLFQAGKVYQHHGLLESSLNLPPVKAKHIAKNVNKHDKLISFQLFDKKFPLKPQTFFYDYLYVNALNQNKDVAKHILHHSAFLDTWANPKYTINTQAKACALYVLLNHKYSTTQFNQIITNPKLFKKIESLVNKK